MKPTTMTVTALLFLFTIMPTALFAATPSGLVVCGNVSGATGVPTSEQCTFPLLMQQVRVVIDFLIFKIAAPLAAVMFVYAGFVYVTNQGNESKIQQAHDIFFNVFIGLVIALGAWLVINMILSFFLGDGSVFNFLG